MSLRPFVASALSVLSLSAAACELIVGDETRTVVGEADGGTLGESAGPSATTSQTLPGPGRGDAGSDGGAPLDAATGIAPDAAGPDTRDARSAADAAAPPPPPPPACTVSQACTVALVQCGAGCTSQYDACTMGEQEAGGGPKSDCAQHLSDCNGHCVTHCVACAMCGPSPTGCTLP